MITTALVLPTPPALLPPVSAVDPVAELREACRVALERLPRGRRVVVAAPVSDANTARGITRPLGHRVADHLLDGATFEARTAAAGAAPDVAASLRACAEPVTLLVMADGSARCDVDSPGQLHPGARPFDESVAAALRAGDAETLARLDPELAEELWCEGVPGFLVLGEVARGREVTAEVTYADAPYGVAWWVARWDLA